jgi:hypothetical protein
MTTTPLPAGAVDAGAFDVDGIRATHGPTLTTGGGRVSAAVCQTTGGDLIMHGEDAAHVLVAAEVALSPAPAREYALQILAAADLAATWAAG